MLRTLDLLAIALSVATLGFLLTPAAAFSGVSSHMVPLQIQTGQLPLPPRTPTVRQPYCATHNCIVPPRNFDGR